MTNKSDVLREKLKQVVSNATAKGENFVAVNKLREIIATERAAIQPAEAVAGSYPYDALFRAIGDATKIESTAIAISVKQFVTTLRSRGFDIAPVAIQPAEPDWSDSKTSETELWKNPLYSLQERLQMADGAVRFRNDVIANLRGQIEAIQPAVDAVARDGCKLCLGAKGGTPGNENVIGGVVVCDYCTSLLMDMKKAGWFAAPVASAPAQPDAWMKERSDECVSDDRKSKMARAGFGVWDEVAAQYTRPLFFSTPSMSELKPATEKEMMQRQIDNHRRTIEELQRVNDERGLQIRRLEVALQRTATAQAEPSRAMRKAVF